MDKTAVAGDFIEPQAGCWCCGDRLVSAGLLRLEGHPEVGVCFRCVDRLAQRKSTIQRTSRHGVIARWRRLQFRDAAAGDWG